MKFEIKMEVPQVDMQKVTEAYTLQMVSLLQRAEQGDFDLTPLSPYVAEGLMDLDSDLRLAQYQVALKDAFSRAMAREIAALARFSFGSPE